METQLSIKVDLLEKLKHAEISKVVDQPILIIQAKSPYIPLEAFKEIFETVGAFVKMHKINKLIFDKREMSTFHQPSMAWYYTDWKERMIPLGLTKHRKILPDDILFRHSVEIGREKIYNKYAGAEFTKLDLKYVESLSEAISI